MSRNWILFLILGLLNFQIATVWAQDGSTSGSDADADFDELEEEEFSKEDAANTTGGMDTVNVEEPKAQVQATPTPEEKIDKVEPPKQEAQVEKKKVAKKVEKKAAKKAVKKAEKKMMKKADKKTSKKTAKSSKKAAKSKSAKPKAKKS